MPIRRRCSCFTVPILVPIRKWLTLLFLHGGEIFKGESAHGGPPECICFHDGLQTSSVTEGKKRRGRENRREEKQIGKQVHQLEYMRQF